MGNESNNELVHDESLHRAIRRHAAFPALQLLLEKCMMAMHFNPSAHDDAEAWRRSHLSDGALVADATIMVASNEIFEIDDVLELLQAASTTTRPKEEQSAADDDGHLLKAEVDQLVRHAILHLRVQLLELEKVWQLCEVFARKYAEFLQRQQLLSSSFHCAVRTHWTGAAACGSNVSNNDTALLAEVGASETRSCNNNNDDDDRDADLRPGDDDNDDMFRRCGRDCAVSVRSPTTSSTAFREAETVTVLPFRKRGHASSKEMEETDKGRRSSTPCVHGRSSTGSCGCAERPAKRCRCEAFSRGNTAAEEIASFTPSLSAADGSDGRAVKTELTDGPAGEERIRTLPPTDSESTTAKVNTFPTFEQIQQHQQQHILAVMMARQHAASMLGGASSSSFPPLHYNNGKPLPVDQQQQQHLLWSQLFLLREHFHGGCPPIALPITSNTNVNITYAGERPSSTPEAST